jgi:hypothetical protein
MIEALFDLPFDQQICVDGYKKKLLSVTLEGIGQQ